LIDARQEEIHPDPPTAGANIMVLARDIDRNRGPVLLRCVLPPE